MTGRLALQILVSGEKIIVIHKERRIHGGLEQLVQVVHSLYQLERNTNQKQLLQLGHDIAVDADANRDRRDQATRGN